MTKGLVCFAEKMTAFLWSTTSPARMTDPVHCWAMCAYQLRIILFLISVETCASREKMTSWWSPLQPIAVFTFGPFRKAMVIGGLTSPFSPSMGIRDMLLACASTRPIQLWPLAVLKGSLNCGLQSTSELNFCFFLLIRNLKKKCFLLVYFDCVWSMIILL